MSTPADEMKVAIQRAGALCELRRFADAAELLRHSIASDPQNPDAWSLLAAAELGAGNLGAALETAERAISLHPESEWPQRIASTTLMRLDRIEESIHHAREAVRLDPNSWPAYTTLARALAKKTSDLPEAREAAERAVALAPTQAEPHITAGVVAATAQDRSGAEASFRQALSIDPENSVAHSELARMQMRGRHRINSSGLADAASGFATSLRLDPRAEPARHKLELVLRLFLGRVSYFIFIDAYLIARIASGSVQPAARVLPVLLLVVPAGYAWRFVNRLSTDLRTYLLHLLSRDRNIRFAVTLDGLAVACLFAATLAPETVRAGLAGGAAVAALIGRLILRNQVEHSSRAVRGQQPRPTFGTPMMWLITIALALTAIVMIVATTTSRAGSGGIVVAVACLAGSGAVLYRIRRRASTEKLTTRSPQSQ